MKSSTTEVIETSNSIEVTQNAKGEYAFKVKRYHSEDDDVQKVIDIIEDTYFILHKKFKN